MGIIPALGPHSTIIVADEKVERIDIMDEDGFISVTHGGHVSREDIEEEEVVEGKQSATVQLELEMETRFALTQPSYSDIASKPFINIVTEEQKKPDEVIPLGGPHVTLIVADSDNEKEVTKDEDGFISITGKRKQLQKETFGMDLEGSDSSDEEIVIDDNHLEDIHMSQEGKAVELAGDIGGKTSVLSGRLSALSDAKRFSCDDKLDELTFEEQRDQQAISAEETSWEFVA